MLPSRLDIRSHLLMALLATALIYLVNGFTLGMLFVPIFWVYIARCISSYVGRLNFCLTVLCMFALYLGYQSYQYSLLEGRGFLEALTHAMQNPQQVKALLPQALTSFARLLSLVLLWQSFGKTLPRGDVYVPKALAPLLLIVLCALSSMSFLQHALLQAKYAFSCRAIWPPKLKHWSLACSALLYNLMERNHQYTQALFLQKQIPLQAQAQVWPRSYVLIGLVFIVLCMRNQIAMCMLACFLGVSMLRYWRQYA